jgi:CHASE2 domain-containing sensor protein
VEILFEDKIVFLGGEFPQDYDRYKTPAGDQYGVRIHAEALASEIVGKTIWVKSRVQIVLAEFAALCLLFLAQHWIRNPAVRFWCVLVGTLFFSVILSWISFNTTVAFLNFVPLLGGIFLDVIKDLAEKGLPDISPKAFRAAAV